MQSDPVNIPSVTEQKLLDKKLPQVTVSGKNLQSDNPTTVSLFYRGNPSYYSLQESSTNPESGNRDKKIKLGIIILLYSFGNFPVKCFQKI